MSGKKMSAYVTDKLNERLDSLDWQPAIRSPTARKKKKKERWLVYVRQGLRATWSEELGDGGASLPRQKAW